MPKVAAWEGAQLGKAPFTPGTFTHMLYGAQTPARKLEREKQKQGRKLDALTSLAIKMQNPDNWTEAANVKRGEGFFRLQDFPKKWRTTVDPQAKTLGTTRALVYSSEFLSKLDPEERKWFRKMLAAQAKKERLQQRQKRAKRAKRAE